MCGISALLLADTKQQCAAELYDSLIVLQHRGQDASGIVTVRSDDLNAKFSRCKGLGLVRDVFSQSSMSKLEGNIGLGHCRYPTVRLPATRLHVLVG